MLTARSKGVTHTLAESADLPVASSKTISASAVLPNVQVLMYGQICIVRCSAYTKAALKSGQAYTLSLGVQLIVGTATVNSSDGNIQYRVDTDGVLTITPKKDIPAKTGINFETMGLMTA